MLGFFLVGRRFRLIFALVLLRLRQHLRDMHAIGDILVTDELDFRRIADDHLLAKLVADKARRAPQRLHQRLALIVLQHGDINFGIAKVAGDFGAGDGECAGHAGVADLVADDAIHLAADFLGNAFNTLIAHDFLLKVGIGEKKNFRKRLVDLARSSRSAGQWV